MEAEDALESALAMYVTAHEKLPVPSTADPGELMIALSGLGMAKAALYDAMDEQGVAGLNSPGVSAGILLR